ncbi:glycyl-tRNA synthetase beta chain [Gracilibacillus halotolerans]|uniref:Glycine--tRNA ligase beta subunit n=1 Tax=Gracilibacillus halotolerans TaxID=74386 RepID=A0A841RKU3_9BACI|nr:glycine--tRNA ligase subunit beta [Gracilibacillus halotolerans]MBB6511815.1 glycyl-tRNA synthetase beta chain [Gracilibacillus halotolerans]
MTQTSNVLFEVGLEEMPARYMNETEVQMKEKTQQWLEEIQLSYKNIKTFITPRRIAIQIQELQLKQDDQEEEVKGPAEKIAKDEAGNWSKAAIGFSKGQGKSVDDIYFKEVNGTNYVFVKKYTKGKTQDELLPDFKQIIMQLTFPKTMRWKNHSFRFIRPIKWLVALKDDEVIPFEITDVSTSNVTYGHRFLGGKIELSHALDYEQLLKDQYVIVDSSIRKNQILQQTEKLQEDKDWRIKIDENLLDEVTNLVEYPTTYYGEFNEEFLSLPKEVLITSMREHQRYFPVENAEGDLLPYFIFVRNGNDDHIQNVSKGNEKVLRARLKDAQFFYEEDQKQSIQDNLIKLEKIIFQEKLGTIADKVNRTKQIAELVASQLNVSEETVKKVTRAATISKFDLVTNMVDEFTELQGTMGHQYALLAGEDEEVAKAIEEHYMPTQSHGQLPETTTGAILSIADKIDTIVGCFTVGLIPTGSQDPYALRRQAIGILEIMKENKWSIPLFTIIERSFDIISTGIDLETNKIEILDQLKTFFNQRTAYIMREAGLEQDIIDAVLIHRVETLSFLIAKGKYLSKKRNDPSFKNKEEAFVRVINLAQKAEENYSIDETLLTQKEEKALYTTWNDIVPEYNQALQQFNVEEAITQLMKLVEPIHEFFDHIMVMDKQESIRNNRLALLKQISNSILDFADFTKVQWKQNHA